MKEAIQERMDNQIELTTKYNQLFDLIVTTTETTFNTTATSEIDNQYVVETEDIKISIICNDNRFNTVDIYIYDSDRGPDASPIASVVTNINGEIDESLHNVPRTIRRTVNDYIDDIYDAIDGWIDDSSNED